MSFLLHIHLAVKATATGGDKVRGSVGVQGHKETSLPDVGLSTSLLVLFDSSG